jgi:hypothetical protein
MRDNVVGKIAAMFSDAQLLGVPETIITSRIGPPPPAPITEARRAAVSRMLALGQPVAFVATSQVVTPYLVGLICEIDRRYAEVAGTRRYPFYDAEESRELQAAARAE